MGEYILRNKAQEEGLADKIYTQSAAISREELGNHVYPPARRELARHGISCEGHAARQVTSRDYDDFDIIIIMEEYHRRILEDRFFGGDPEGKIHMCMEYAGRPRETVEDPWYTGRFAEVYDQISESAEGILARLK